MSAQLKMVAEDNPNCVPARVFLGHIYRVEERIGEAKAMYESALALDKNHLEASSSLRLLNKRRLKKLTFFERVFKKS